MNVIGPGTDPTERTDVDDVSPSAELHQLCRLLTAKEHRLQVYRMNEIPIGFRDVERIKPGKAGSIVYKSVEATEALADILEEGDNPGYVREVRAEELAAALFCRPAGVAFRRRVMDSDPGSFACESKCDGTSDSACRACDEDDLSVKGSHFPIMRPGAVSTTGDSCPISGHNAGRLVPQVQQLANGTAAAIVFCETFLC
jgi:hypothetical protein